MEQEYSYKQKEFWDDYPAEAREFGELERQYGEQYYKSGMIFVNGSRHHDVEKRFGELLSMRAGYYDQERAKYSVGFRPKESPQEQHERMERGAHAVERTPAEPNVVPMDGEVVSIKPREVQDLKEGPDQARKAAA